jgi:hypothetical protein
MADEQKPASAGHRRSILFMPKKAGTEEIRMSTNPMKKKSLLRVS